MISLTGRPDTGASSATAYKSGPRQDYNGLPTAATLRNPTLSISKISMDTNVTTSLPIMVRPWADGYEKQFAQGSILFVLCDDKQNRLETVADVPTLNFMLEEAHNNQKNYTSGMFNELKTKFEGKVNMFGVLRNDMYADSKLQKLLNVDVFGRAMVANLWGRLVRGDHVGLALKKVDTKKNGFVQPDNSVLPSSIINAPADGIMQVLPVCNGLLVDEPDKDKAKTYELYIPLGVVSHAVARTPSMGHRQSALRSQSHYTLLPRIEILMI
tara:strand:+ start:976 stop:1785 length:810 start_codon:yes stop_codon:yes gene_type:complete